MISLIENRSVVARGTVQGVEKWMDCFYVFFSLNKLNKNLKKKTKETTSTLSKIQFKE